MSDIYLKSLLQKRKVVGSTRKKGQLFDTDRRLKDMEDKMRRMEHQKESLLSDIDRKLNEVTRLNEDNENLRIEIVYLREQRDAINNELEQEKRKTVSLSNSIEYLSEKEMFLSTALGDELDLNQELSRKISVPEITKPKNPMVRRAVSQTAIRKPTVPRTMSSSLTRPTASTRLAERPSRNLKK